MQAEGLDGTGYGQGGASGRGGPRGDPHFAGHAEAVGGDFRDRLAKIGVEVGTAGEQLVLEPGIGVDGAEDGKLQAVLGAIAGEDSDFAPPGRRIHATSFQAIERWRVRRARGGGRAGRGNGRL